MMTTSGGSAQSAKLGCKNPVIGRGALSVSDLVHTKTSNTGVHQVYERIDQSLVMCACLDSVRLRCRRCETGANRPMADVFS
jgi:hypothetical protein